MKGKLITIFLGKWGVWAIWQGCQVRNQFIFEHSSMSLNYVYMASCALSFIITSILL
jgi:hypothetical protein